MSTADRQPEHAREQAFDQGTLSAEPAVAYAAEEAILQRIFQELQGLSTLQQQYDVSLSSCHTPIDRANSPSDIWDELLDGDPAVDDDPFLS
jgi:hypothetical protein